MEPSDLTTENMISEESEDGIHYLDPVTREELQFTPWPNSKDEQAENDEETNDEGSSSEYNDTDPETGNGDSNTASAAKIAKKTSETVKGAGGAETLGAAAEGGGVIAGGGALWWAIIILLAILGLCILAYAGAIIYHAAIPSSINDSSGNGLLVSGDHAGLIKKFNEYIKDGRIKVDGQINIDDVRKGLIKVETLRLMLTIADFLNSKNLYLQVSCTKSDHNKYASSGNISNHYYGKAFDIGNESIAKVFMPWATRNAKMLKINELIFDNSLIGESRNKYNLRRGEPHSYNGSTLNQHRNHIHISAQ